MQEHIRIGREYPQIDLNTSYSFGLDDQEFVVAFETDEPAAFLDLVQRLRTTEASAYTKRDTPTFTCVSTSVERALSALDGAPAPRRPLRSHDLAPRLRRDPRHHDHRRRPGRALDRVLGRDARGVARASSTRCPSSAASCTTLYPGEVDLRRARPPAVLAKDLVEQLREQALEQFDVPGPPRDDRRRDRLRGRRRVVAAHRPGRPALAHGDRRRRPRRLRAQEAAGLRRRHDAVGGPRRALPRRREDGVRGQARGDRRRRRLRLRLGREPARHGRARSRSCTAATASAPTRRRSREVMEARRGRPRRPQGPVRDQGASRATARSRRVELHHAERRAESQRARVRRGAAPARLLDQARPAEGVGLRGREGRDRRRPR